MLRLLVHTQVVRTIYTATPTGTLQRRRTLTRRLGGAVLVVGTLGAVGVGLAAFNDPGVERSIKFWRRAFPIYLHYRWIQWRTRNEPAQVVEAEYNRLHDKYAAVGEQITLDLKGYYLKVAQIISTRDEFLPEQYMRWCKKLQSEVPTPLDVHVSRQVVERELKVRIEDVFTEWEDTPVGAASIGQVHRARLKDGREVAVKIQYPGIEQMFRADIKTIIAFCRLAQPQHVPALLEIQRQFETEFDYVGEAKNLKAMHDTVMPVWRHVVRIPEPVTHLSTRNVLVMDYLQGTGLIPGIREMYSKLAAMQGRTLDELEHEQKAAIKAGTFVFKTPEQQAQEMRRIQWRLKLHDIKVNTGRFLYNWTLGWIKPPKSYERSEAPIILGDIIQTLAAVHGWEIFQNGMFNADPHPGNMMLLQDGRLGLIDFGQVKRLDVTTRIAYAKLMIALDRNDKDEVVRIITQELGARTKHMNPDIIYRVTAFWNDRDSDDITGGRSIQAFMDWAQEQDPLVESSSEIVLAARVSVLLRGLGLAFGIRMSMSHYFRPYAEAFLASQGISY